MKVFWKLLIANFKHFSRERAALFFTFFFPIMFMLIFGLVFSGDNDMADSFMDKTLGLATLEGESVLRDTIIGALELADIFSITEDNVDATLGRLNDGEVNVVLEIPADIDARVAAGEPVTLTLHYNPAATTAAWQLPVIGQIVDSIGHGISGQPALLSVSQVVTESGNGGGSPTDNFGITFMVPGILAMSVLFLGLQGVMPIVEWRENKTLKRLGASPLNRGLIVYSQIAQRVILSVIQAAILIGIAYFVFDVNMSGNWWLLLGMLLLGTLALISIGFLIVARASTVEGAVPMVMGIQFPMMFLSGIFFPIEMMPDFMRPILAALPLTYLGDAFRQIMVDAAPLYPLWVDAAVLGGWLVISMVLAVRFFKWE